MTKKDMFSLEGYEEDGVYVLTMRLFNIEGLFSGLGEMMASSPFMRGPPRPKLKLSKGELVAYATQIDLGSLEAIIKDLTKVLERRKAD